MVKGDMMHKILVQVLRLYIESSLGSPTYSQSPKSPTIDGTA